MAVQKSNSLPPRSLSGGLVSLMRDPELESQQRPLDWRLIWRAIQLMEPFRRERNWLIVCTLLRAVQVPLFAWAVGAVINGPISHHASGYTILVAASGVLALAIFTQVTMYYRIRLALDLGEAVVNLLRRRLFAHLQTMPMSYFHNTKIGRMISRISSDCDAVRVGVQDVLFVTLVGGGQMVVSALLMAAYDVVLFGVLLVMTPVMFWLNHFFRSRLSTAYRQLQESFSRVTATLAESVAGIRITQGYAREGLNAKLFADLAVDHAAYNMTAAKTSGAFLPLLELNSQIFLAALLAIGGWRALKPDPDASVGDLIQFFFLANVFFGPIQILGSQYNSALTAMAGAERVFGLLDRKPEWTDVATPIHLPRISGGIEFDHVGFGYLPQRPVLHDICLKIEPGQSVALVGPTGSGKSSMINLVARFYLPTSGRLLIDGYDSRSISRNSLSSQLGIVLQQNFLFTGTVRENLCYGVPTMSDDRIEHTLNELGCQDLINQLPDGLNSRLGSGGIKLSLGQRQLLCICRAILVDPRILILDEATSSIDTITELRIQKAMRAALQGRTSLIVAHRLSTIRTVDKLVVLDEGRIVQTGTHAELIAKPGLYATLSSRFISPHEFPSH